MLTLTLCGLGLLLTPREAPTVEARVPNTYLGIALQLEGFQENVELTREAGAALGERAVLFGSIGPTRASLSIIAERSEGEATSEAWRARLTEGEPLLFSIGGTSCSEAREAPGEEERIEFHAFLLAGGYCFDLRVRTGAEAGPDALSREAFVEMVRSFRVALLRRGWRADYPAAVLALMHEAAVRAPRGEPWLREEAARRSDDYAVPFVRAEMLEVSGGPVEETLAAYARASALLDGLEAPTPAQRFARAVCADGSGLTLAKSGRAAEALAHYRKGHAIAASLGHAVRGPLAYNLACAAAQTGENKLALDYLERAIGVLPRYRAMAGIDVDFETLRGDARFRRLVGGGR
ncbi:MAG: tetratricopeptide repeat protein [Planctomycetota bacterium]|nr:tetratricopeptide repeat protein [Planctomycetota bacterium]